MLSRPVRWLALICGALGVVLVLLGGSIYLLGKYEAGLCADEETARVTSPDGQVDALVVQRDCGATTAYVYAVVLVPKGITDPDWNLHSFLADKVDQDIQVRWLSDRELRIEYAHANIHHFSNFWYHPKLVGDSRPPYEVRISEGPLQSSGAVN